MFHKRKLKVHGIHVGSSFENLMAQKNRNQGEMGASHAACGM